jgi:hypothetical protein
MSNNVFDINVQISEYFICYNIKKNIYYFQLGKIQHYKELKSNACQELNFIQTGIGLCILKCSIVVVQLKIKIYARIKA